MRLYDLCPRQDLLHKHLQRAVLELGQVLLELVAEFALIFCVAAAETAALDAETLGDEGGDGDA